MYEGVGGVNVYNQSKVQAESQILAERTSTMKSNCLKVGDKMRRNVVKIQIKLEKTMRWTIVCGGEGGREREEGKREGSRSESN